MGQVFHHHKHLLLLLKIRLLMMRPSYKNKNKTNGGVRLLEGLAVASGVEAISFVDCSMHCTYSATVQEACLGQPVSWYSAAAATEQDPPQYDVVAQPYVDDAVESRENNRYRVHFGENDDLVDGSALH